MTKLTAALFAIAFFGFSVVASAADCEIHVERAACPGKEADSYAKCGGKPACSSTKSVNDESACRKMAEAECTNSRLDVTKHKAVKYTFAGKQSPNVCAADRPDFNKCPAK